ncbi:MAG: HpaII family restriction endonuclease [Methylotenera sp.]|nr:HpaII family restriction endonuclease [Methylotenera sp.]
MVLSSPNLELFTFTAENLNADSESFKAFTFIDLFAGIGGFHQAIGSLGGNCLFASEKDTHAKATYMANFDISPNHFNDDIRKIAPIDVPNHDVLCAGFPCQPFSQAGHKKGFADGENSERGNLFYCILDILEIKRPKAFILENVRHLVAHDNGNTFATILKHLNDANYEVSFKVIKASDFNVPQHRARVFIVGFDRSQVDTSASFNFPIPIPLKKTMADIFNAPCDKKIGFTLRVGGKGSKIDDRRNYEFYRVNGEVRRINLDEARELMSFPKDFKFPVSKSQAMKQLGNSVCVEVVKAVGRSVLQYLQKNQKNSEREIMQNKGEISETYALLKIIHQKVLQYGDTQGVATDDAVRVLKIKSSYKAITINELSIEIVSKNASKDIETTTIKIDDLITQQELNEIVKSIQQSSGTFNNARIDEAVRTLGSIKTKGTSYEKSDITLDFHDEIHHINQGVSIKSFLGSSPTLLNASSATNFIFEVTGLAASEVDVINAIDTRSKIKDRLAKITELGGHFQFIACENKTYESNLRKADSAMPEILADALLSFFKKESSNRLSDYFPVSVKLDASEAHCRLRDFIKYTVFGIFPSSIWDGELSANGAILVKDDGELVFYHTNHEKTLKDYFYQHCFFDTPSSTRHRFGSLYKEGNKLHFKLNLQLRLAH